MARDRVRTGGPSAFCARLFPKPAKGTVPFAGRGPHSKLPLGKRGRVATRERSLDENRSHYRQHGVPGDHRPRRRGVLPARLPYGPEDPPGAFLALVGPGEPLHRSQAKPRLGRALPLHMEGGRLAPRGRPGAPLRAGGRGAAGARPRRGGREERHELRGALHRRRPSGTRRPWVREGCLPASLSADGQLCHGIGRCGLRAGFGAGGLGRRLGAGVRLRRGAFLYRSPRRVGGPGGFSR